MEMIELRRAWNWVAFGYLSGDVDERMAQGFVANDGRIHIAPAFSEEEQYETLGRLALARDLIGAAVERGTIDLYGTRSPTDSSSASGGDSFAWEKIPPAFLAEAGFEGWDDDITLIGHTAEYHSLYLPFSQLRALLPFWGNAEVFLSREPTENLLPGLEPPEPPVRATAAAENECAKLISALSEKVPGEVRSKKDVWTRAKAQIGDRLSYKAFVRAWDRSAPSAWKKPGRKPLSRFE